MVNLTISMVIAYLLAGVSQVTEDLTADPIRKPFWAMRPTVAKAMLYGVTWPLRPLVGEASSARDVAFAAMNLIVAFSMTTGWVWLTLLISEYFFQSALARVVSMVIILPLSSRFILPWVALLTMPLMLVLAFPLD
jgi:hypothetical protein